VSSIEKKESKKKRENRSNFKKKQYVAWKEESGRKRGQKREKSVAAVVGVLYPKEEGAWIGAVLEYCLLLKVANV
jgi:hypothetical protein